MGKVFIIQPRIDDKHLDSLWYDGEIAETEHYKMYAAGDIRIYRNDKDGNYLGMYDGKSRDDFGEIKDDEDIERMFNSLDYNIDMNNWFEIVSKEEPDELGEVYNGYDDCIQILEDLEKEYV